jgi:hypothetical protein
VPPLKFPFGNPQAAPSQLFGEYGLGRSTNQIFGPFPPHEKTTFTMRTQKNRTVPLTAPRETMPPSKIFFDYHQGTLAQLSGRYGAYQVKNKIFRIFVVPKKSIFTPLPRKNLKNRVSTRNFALILLEKPPIMVF